MGDPKILELLKDAHEYIELHNITLSNLVVKKNQNIEINDDETIKICFNADEPKIEMEEKNIIIFQPIVFQMYKGLESSDAEPTDSTNLFKINIEYELFYEKKKDLKENFIEEYSKNNIPRILHPYIREIISSIMAKCGLPPFTLPLFENL